RVCVKKDWLEDVVRKDRYRVNNKHDETHPPLPLSKILWQTEELVGKEMPYSLSSQNCENFVMELRYGPEMSEQVRGLAWETCVCVEKPGCAYRREGKFGGAASVLAVLSDRAYVKKDWLETVVRSDQYRVNNKHDHTYPPLPLSKTLERAEELVTEAIAVGTIGMMGVAAAMIRSAAKWRKHYNE
ncbi:hypothetical protein E2320_013857, partial [Naja naja]